MVIELRSRLLGLRSAFALGLVLGLALLVQSGSVHAAGGGTINFNNRALPEVDAPVVDTDGTTRLSGTAFRAQLYAGPTADALAPIGTSLPFRTGTAAGYVASSGVGVPVPTVNPGQIAHVQMRVWAAASGATYEQAIANNGKAGVSATLTLVTGGSGEPPSVPANLAGLKPFGLSTSRPPQITAHPENQTVVAGGTARFSVTATGAGTLRYQWKRNGENLGGRTSATLNLTDVTLAQAGSYSVVVTGSGGFVESRAASLTVTGLPFVRRVLPGGYAPGVKLLVTLQASPPTGTSSYGIEEQLPVGWSFGVISDMGSYDSVNRKIVWIFLDGTARTLTYEVIPPTGANGVVLFAGVASADGLGSPVQGSDRVSPGLLHPADNTPADNQLVLNEVTAYAAAYKKGQVWPVAPNPIPIGYVTRAAALYRGGGKYVYDPKIATAPAWWVNPVLPARAGRLAVGDSPSNPSAAVRNLPEVYVPTEPVEVTLEVKPAAGVLSWAIEEVVPELWTVTEASEGGEWDPTQRKIKWVFLDGTPRVLSYLITSSSRAMGNRKFEGLASFDGVDVPVTGDGQLRPGARMRALQKKENGDVSLELRGEVGARYVVEVSDDLKEWTVFATLENKDGLLDIVDSAKLARRFYRVRKLE